MPISWAMDLTVRRHSALAWLAAIAGLVYSAVAPAWGLPPGWPSSSAFPC